MKKNKILSLMLVAVMIVGLLAGCGAGIKKKDIEANPGEYIEAGLRKSFEKSPFGDLMELKDTEATSLSVNVTPTQEEGHIDFSTVFAHDELAILANLDSDIEGEKLNGSLFIDKNNFAIKADMLKDFFNTASIGVSTNDFGNNLMKSAWYELLIVDTGLEEELKAELESEDELSVTIQSVLDAYMDFFKELKGISKTCVKYEVSECKVEIDGKKVKAYEVVHSISDDATDKINAATEKLMNSLKVLMPSEFDEEYDNMIERSLDDMTAEIKKSMEKSKLSYIIDKKSGAMLEIHYNNSELIPAESDEEKIESHINFVASFGSKPESVFAPRFDGEILIDKDKMTITGESTIDASAKTFNFNVDAYLDYFEEDDWTKDEATNINVTLHQDGTYQFASKYDDEETKFDGKFNVDGSKVLFTANIRDEEELLGVVTTNIDFNAAKPTTFEYDDLMQWDKAKILEFVEKISAANSYEDDMDDYYSDYDMYDYPEYEDLIADEYYDDEALDYEEFDDFEESDDAA